MAIEPDGDQIKRRHRSPNYPVIGLETAIERVEKLYKANKSHLVPLRVACRIWEYTQGSSVADQNIAALRSFGLIQVEGQGDSREIAVTDEARRIILKSPERDLIIKRLATNPPIYKELWDKYGPELPTDDTLTHYLLFRKPAGFNDDVVGTVIDRYKQTIQFAKLSADDIIEEANQGVSAQVTTAAFGADEAPIAAQKRPMAQPGTKQDVFTLDEGQVVLQWPSNLSAASFQDLKDWIGLALRKIGRAVANQAADQGESPSDCP